MPRACFSKPTDQCPQPSGEEQKGKPFDGGRIASPDSLSDEGLWPLLVCIVRNLQQAAVLPLLLIMTANQSERAIDKNGDEIQIWAWVPNRRFYSYLNFNLKTESYCTALVRKKLSM